MKWKNEKKKKWNKQRNIEGERRKQKSDEFVISKKYILGFFESGKELLDN